jgi:hypothetical protein
VTWRETDHPRDGDGRFTDKPGGGIPDGWAVAAGPVRDAKPGSLVEWDGQYRELASATRAGMDIDLVFTDGTTATVGFGRQANIATPPKKTTRAAAKKPPKQPDWAARLSHRIDENEYRHRAGDAAHGDDALDAAGYRQGQDPDLDDALTDYQSLGAASSDLNAWLRGELKKPPDLTHAGSTTDPTGLVRLYDRATQPSTRDLVAYRGMGRRTFGDAWDRDLTGYEYDDHGFTSLSADDRIAQQYAASRGSDSVVASYLIPAGTGTATIGTAGSHDTDTEAFGEQDAEILVQRRLRYRVVRDNRPTGGGLEIAVVGSAR